jgi:glycosyltransferase involved in cell wall biosynthesis
LLNRIRVRIAKFVLPKADGVRVVSKRISNSILENEIVLKRPVDVLPIRVDIASLTPKPEVVDALKKRFFASHPHWQFIVLMVSRLEKEKRIDVGIKAFAKCSEKFPNMGLIIVGDGSLKNKLRDLVYKLHVEKSVVFEGWSESVSAYFDLAEAYLLTSNYEGYAMSLVEAAIAKCPVITTNVGIADQFFKDGYNGFVCPVGDDNCITVALYKLISDNWLRDSFKRLSKEEIVRSIPSELEFAKQYVQLLKNAISNHNLNDK